MSEKRSELGKLRREVKTLTIIACSAFAIAVGHIVAVPLLRMAGLIG